jgi:thiol-disulfide isomerase/thioredoxin
MFDFASKFGQGLAYDDFLQQHGIDEQRGRWQSLFEQVKLSDAQRGLVASFTREMRVLCLAGAWCGDCVRQCPIYEHFARANSRIAVRYFDRDTHAELAAELRVCGGARVPVVVFLSEDDFEVGRFGDRTLSTYRTMAAEQLGAACPTGIVPPRKDLLDAVTQDWLDVFERAQLILRTSGRLREKHGD